MTAEGRIGFEIGIGLPCVILIILRAWLLSRFKRARFGNSVTNAALYLTLLCIIGCNGCNIWISAKIIKYQHVDVTWDPTTGVPLPLLQTTLKISVALKYFYVVGLYAAKAALFGIFVEMEQYLERRLRVFVKVAIWVTVAVFVANLLLTMLWCLPFDRSWSMNPKTLCSTFRSMVVVGFGTATNILTDLAIIAIPLFILRTLPLRRRELYAIAFILFLGLICIAASIVRFVFLWDFIYGYGDHKFPLSHENFIVYASEIEVVIAIWAGCLPALRALLRHNRTSVSGSGMPPNCFSNNGPNDGSRSINTLGMGNTGAFSPQPIDPGDRENSVTVRPSSWTGNPIVAKGFGYGGYGAGRDAAEVEMKRHSSRQQNSRAGDCERHNVGDDIDHKSSLDSERDGSDFEMRSIIPLSPRRSPQFKVR
ncbi:hypothetical protein L211DRAFT_348070 [Terfezia boudieri ATCC MYA-4762]|uniref:Rhodopsin domain-containing protein n=1 Tax=Terfezia boudieri ATCC MYA-4762 TaxID=1051890 RepID=A0A3N4LVM0_9PEZI|nr:hypothetical protein L211DRAFT_348070 [Terfezia boudieri ATCC MYA-4762]